ncbi:hypothetical protein CXG81DRAFT_9742, partial [Caulochytrium protostelioides]
MSDDYDAGGPGGEEDLSLPKATVHKLIQEMMPPDIACSKETRDVLSDCCVEFIHLISSEANDVCEKTAKKTIAGEHVLQALENLGFGDFVPDVRDVYEEHTHSLKEREVRSLKQRNIGLSAEELQRAQEALFAQAKMKL